MNKNINGAGLFPSQAQLDAWLAFAHQLADAANALMMPALSARPSAQMKADKSMVTALDTAIEMRLREMIAQKYPEHGVLGEEAPPYQLNADAVWVLDPIDGTAPFIAGVPVFGSLIALTWQGKPVIGIMHLPATQQRYVGVTGRASTLNSKLITTRSSLDCVALSDAMMSNSNPDFLNALERPVLDALRSATAWRIYGGCCMSYGLLASGRTDLALDAGFKVWDYAPFVPLIEGAGGVISDWQGRPLTLQSGSQVLAAGNAELHKAALALISTIQAAQ